MIEMAGQEHPPLHGLGREIFEKLPAPTLIVDADVAVFHANRAARRVLGVDGVTLPLLRRRGGDLLHCIHSYEEGGCGRQQVCQDCVIRDAVGMAFEHRVVQRSHTVLELRSGTGVTEASFLVSAAPIDSGGETQVILTLDDVTDLDRLRRDVGLTEKALRESQRFLLLSQEIARIGSYVFNVPGDRWSSSPALDAIFGIDGSYPRKASDWLQIIHPEDRESMALYLADLLVRGSRFDREYRIMDRRSGEMRWVHGLGELQRGPGGEPIELVGTIQDVTTRKMADIERGALQVKLALASRLAAMGTLVAGVAHEINNPLAADLAGQAVALEEAREFRRQFQGEAPQDVDAGRRRLDLIIEALEDAREGGQRVASIVRDLASFANPDSNRTRLRLGEVAATAIRWMPIARGEGVGIRVEDRDPPPVLASPGQIEQVVVNLLANAAKAMPPGKRGDIIVRIGPGGTGKARLEVIDHGVGIDPRIRERIFEPFFTTRRVGLGKGAGLGLAICHAIVAAHDGTLTVESEVGKGSTFRVELPAVAAET